ncbi:hypothetical protein ACEWY4_024938 [Coilia grayii]|uniref:Ig-like domain-containing protein n=1 Tax=Coilia grayii TaxID=363190 RepID=A0ABD1IX65_9TELE
MSRHRSPFLYSTGVLALILLQGVCVWSEDTRKISAVVGGSVVLPSGYQRKDVKNADWLFGNIVIAEYTGKDIVFPNSPQFNKRIHVDPSNFSLTLSEIRKDDSGQFVFVPSGKNNEQLPRNTLQLQVYESTLKVHITQNVSIQPNNTCMFSLTCSASGPPDATFSWTGHQTGSGASVHFSLLPADGSVNLKCSAQSGQNRDEKDEKEVVIKCDNKTLNGSTIPEVVNPTKLPETEILWYVYHVIIPAAGGLIIVLLSTAVGVCCYRKHRGNEDNTCYADVTVGRKDIPARSVSVINEMSIYETVDERAVGIHNKPQPQTLYDRVNFSRPEGKKPVCANPSSPYQEVL